VPDARLASGGLLLLAALTLAAPSTREAAARRLRFAGTTVRSRRRTARRKPSRVTLASALAGISAALLVGQPLAIAAGPTVFILSRALLRRLADRAAGPEPARVSAFAVELVAACLDAGATPAAALQAAGEHVPGALGEALSSAADALSAGAPVEEALPEAGPLAPVAAVFRRSSQTGSAMSEQLIGAAAQLRADEQFERLAKAHRVAVLSALPLGLCMLPAFLVLAVVPAVMGLGAGLLP
jgi:pilus assembly protein TadC